MSNELKVLTSESLAPYTSWRVGGLAERYYRATCTEDFVALLSMLPLEEPLTCLGLGSNVLISDEGLAGSVIHLLYTSKGIEVIETNDAFAILRVEAGIPCAKLAKIAVKEGLMGAEFFAGIPGTIGGALAMNAGAWGSETWRLIDRCEIVNRRGEKRVVWPSDFQIGYRSVIGLRQDEWFTAGYFKLPKGDPKQGSERIKELMKERQLLQPIGTYSCGSVFKNPKDGYAGQLIEAAGLKGYQIGGAQVSKMHANFILNTRTATAKDIYTLIHYLQQCIVDQFGILLQPEVRFLGW